MLRLLGLFSLIAPLVACGGASQSTRTQPQASARAPASYQGALAIGSDSLHTLTGIRARQVSGAAALTTVLRVAHEDGTWRCEVDVADAASAPVAEGADRSAEPTTADWRVWQTYGACAAAIGRERGADPPGGLTDALALFYAAKSGRYTGVSRSRLARSYAAALGRPLADGAVGQAGVLLSALRLARGVSLAGRGDEARQILAGLDPWVGHSAEVPAMTGVSHLHDYLRQREGHHARLVEKLGALKEKDEPAWRAISFVVAAAKPGLTIAWRPLPPGAAGFASSTPELDAAERAFEAATERAPAWVAPCAWRQLVRALRVVDRLERASATGPVMVEGLPAAFGTAGNDIVRDLRACIATPGWREAAPDDEKAIVHSMMALGEALRAGGAPDRRAATAWTAVTSELAVARSHAQDAGTTDLVQATAYNSALWQVAARDPSMLSEGARIPLAGPTTDRRSDDELRAGLHGALEEGSDAWRYLAQRLGRPVEGAPAPVAQPDPALLAALDAWLADDALAALTEAQKENLETLKSGRFVLERTPVHGSQGDPRALAMGADAALVAGVGGETILLLSPDVLEALAAATPDAKPETEAPPRPAGWDDPPPEVERTPEGCFARRAGPIRIVWCPFGR